MTNFPKPADLRALAEATRDRTTEWEIAVHEAGHVVASIALGQFPDLVYLNDDPSDESHGGRVMTRGVHPAIMSSDDPVVARAIEREKVRYAVVLAAGDVARETALGFELDVGHRRADHRRRSGARVRRGAARHVR